jgi:hypothetical protein
VFNVYDSGDNRCDLGRGEGVMDGVTKWAAALCFAAIGCTALQMLAPKKGMGNIFRMITAAFFLCCMAAPLLSMKSILPINIDGIPQEVSAEVIKERVKQQLHERVTEALFKQLDRAFKNYDISLVKVEVNMDTEEDDSIYISGVVLYLDKQSSQKLMTAKEVAQGLLGVEVDVTIQQD